jgi:hypothetical protein
MIIIVLSRTSEGLPTLTKKEATKKFYVGELVSKEAVASFNHLSLRGKCVQYLHKNISENSKKKYNHIDLNNYKVNNINCESGAYYTCIPLAKFNNTSEYIKQCSTEREFLTLIDADQFCKKDFRFNVWKERGLLILSKSFDENGKELSADYDIEKFFPGMK